MKRKVVLALSLVSSCGTDVVEQIDSENDPPKTPTVSCHVDKVDGEARISCPDGSEVIVADGQAGENGSPGNSGPPGSKGPEGVVGTAGPAGSDGSTGSTGASGSDGSDAATVSVYDSSGYLWGTMVATEYRIGVRLPSGRVLGIYAVSPYEVNYQTNGVYYASTDCSGTGYLNPEGSRSQDLSYVKSKSKWFTSSGTLKTGLAYQSRETSSTGSCTTTSGTLTPYYDAAEVDMSGYSARIDYSPAGYPRISAGPFYFD